MRRLLSTRPSASMAVAFVALLAALSGTAVALPGKNTVDSGDIKKGAVKSADVGRNAVTGSKVKNDTLTGSDVNESTFGRVPSATSAATATNATNAVNATNATNASNAANANRAATAGGVDGRIPFLVKLSAGESKTIATNGAVSFVVECLTAAGNDRVRILAATTQDGAALHGDTNSYSGAPGDTLDVLTPPDDRQMAENNSADGTPNVSWQNDQGWVMAPDGKTLGIDGDSTPLGLNFAGAECVVSGVVNASG
jgi:hypothetical protein